VEITSILKIVKKELLQQRQEINLLSYDIDQCKKGEKIKNIFLSWRKYEIN